MEDPLLLVDRLSNPAQVWFFTKNKKRILLLGDIHTEQILECAFCEAPICLDYTTLLLALERYHKESNTDLDVFIEMFAPEHSKSYANRLSLAASTLGGRLYRLLRGTSLNLIETRTRLLPKLFFHKDSQGIGQRFHYFDFRETGVFKHYGLDVQRYFGDVSEDAMQKYSDEFIKRYPTKQSIRKLTHTLLFSTVSKTFKNRSNLSHGKTRMAKQITKLTPSDTRLIRSFSNSELELLFKLNYKLPMYTFTFILDYMTFLTDIYALARFLRFFKRQVPGSTSVFLAGLSHTERYARFLKKWSATELFTSFPVNKQTQTYEHSKCVPVDLKNKTRKNRHTI